MLTRISKLAWLGFILMIIGISFIWSVGLNREWGTDYGVYYTGASFLSNDYRLYIEHFDHKGPVYYAFLRVVGEIIGFGPLQAVASLFLTTLFFMGSLFWVVNLVTKSKKNILIVILISGAVLAFQPTNASLSLFQSGILIWSFYFLYINSQTKAEKPIYFSMALLIIAGLIRIDGFAFAPMYLLAQFNNKSNLQNFIKITLVGLIILVVLFQLFSLAFGYNLSQFINHNLIFNIIHSTSRGPELWYRIYRPESYKLFLVSGIPLVLFSLFKHLQKNSTNYLLMMISTIGFLMFLYTNSDKNYHLFILYTPLLFSIILLVKNHKFESLSQYILLSSLLIYPNVINSYNFLDFWVDIKDQNFPSLISENDLVLVNEMQAIGEGYGIFERSWIYLFADVSPKMSLEPLIYSRRYEDNNTFFRTTEQANLHNNLLQAEGQIFILNRGYVFSPGTWMQELLESSFIVKETDYYQIRQIGKGNK